jgi:hypothetical protein
MSNGNGHRWSKFWWRDHQGDAALRACSLAARGYWMEVLCIMHGATPVGHLLINGRSPTNRQMSAICGCSEKEVRAHTAELEAAGVFSRSPDGTIWCRRMVRDAAESEAGRSWGRTGGNPTLKANANGEAKPGGLTPPHNTKVNEGGSTQKLEAEEESKKGPPLGPPPSRGGRPAVAIPEDWFPNPKAVALGVILGLSSVEVAFEAEKMRDWARSKPSKAADWDARFNNWMRNEISDRSRRRFLPNPAKPATLAEEWGLKSFLTPDFDDEETPPERLLS